LLGTGKAFCAVLAPGDVKAATIQLIMDKRTQHGIVLDREYAWTVDDGGIHWRLRLILKAAIIQDCRLGGNDDDPTEVQVSSLTAI